MASRRSSRGSSKAISAKEAERVSDSEQEPSSSNLSDADTVTPPTSVSTPLYKALAQEKQKGKQEEQEDSDDQAVITPRGGRRSQRASAKHASVNLKAFSSSRAAAPVGGLDENVDDSDQDEDGEVKRQPGTSTRKAPSSGTKRKRAAAASPPSTEDDSGSGDNFAPDEAADGEAQQEDSDSDEDSDLGQQPGNASDDEDEDEDALVKVRSAVRRQKKQKQSAQSNKKKGKASVGTPKAVSEDENDSDELEPLPEGLDLDGLIAWQAARESRKPKYSEEDRRRMRSHTPEETPDETKQRKQREKDYSKSRGADFNYADKVQLKLEKHHPELVNVWENLESEVNIIKPSKAPQPDFIAQKLLPFQLEGLDWMKRQEGGPWRGGMLADEMGMGKTIQTISLVCSDYDPSLPMKQRKKTLVIAPTVAIVQWRNEFSKFTKGFKVDVWHGSSRASDVQQLENFDVILTSYAVLESVYRRQEKGFVRNKNNVKEKSVLHAIKWHRIILDEAHNIKDRGSNTAKATFALHAAYRWCLSGTPLQNRVGELYSLIRFLGVLPFAANFCTKCPCRTLHWKFSNKKHCDDCGHTPMQHSWYWNNQILKPIQKYGHTGDGGIAFKKLHCLLDRMMLRRTKVERADDLSLPPRTVTVRRDYFTEEEEELYTSLYSDVQRKFGTYIEAGTVLNNYGNIFTLITRMRQMACHPDLVLKSKTAKYKITEQKEGDFSINTCRICLDEAEDPIMSKCRHIFCRVCIADVVEGCGTDNMPECPTCHARLVINLEAPPLETEPSTQTKGAAHQGMLDRIDPRKWKTSTKIVGLMEELMKLRQDDHTSKALVFSTSTSFLDLIARQLQLGGFKFARLQGTMAPEQRDRTVKYFMNNVDVQVFLLSLKAGGVALNLTEASHVFLVDPWWNPSAEVQAMDRIHRIGQTRPVKVTRLIIENSIESRILELQKKKESMVSAAFGDNEALGRLTPEDLRFLFTL